MCSIGEDDFDDEGAAHSMEGICKNLKTLPLGEICKKCNQAETVVRIDFREPECKQCFLSYVRHKFRATIGSSKIIPKGADVLVIFDGSPESITLIDMIHYALNQDNFKKLRCNVKILCIDENHLMANSEETVISMNNILNAYDLEKYFIALTSSNRMPMKFTEYQELDNLQCEKNDFMQILEGIKTLTSKQDFIEKIRKQIIRYAAKYLSCKFILVSDICSDLASEFLKNISLGGGRSIASDISLVDDRTTELKIFRPIKDLSVNEIQNYIQLNNLVCLNIKKYGENRDSNLSIQNTTQAFVKNLQENFPSTISTIFRTGDKIVSSQLSNSQKQQQNGMISNERELGVCIFCNSMLAPSNSNTLEAIQFSKLVSTTRFEDINIDGQNLNKFNDEFLEDLCHSCRNIHRDFNNKDIFKDVVNKIRNNFLNN